MNLSQYIIEKVRLNPERESPFLFPGDRWNWLPDLCNLAGFTVGAEIGVAGGRFSERLLKTIPDLTLYAIDPWAEDERDYRKAVEKLTPFERCRILRARSLDAVDYFDDGSLDFIYLDADRRYASVIEDLDAWNDKVRAGGIMCGCCYYNIRGTGERVKDAVNHWALTSEIDPWFVLVHHRYPCYLWVKP